MSYANGRIPRSALAPITIAANGEQAYLIKEAAAAFMDMNAESERRYGVTLRATSARCAYRPLVDQRHFWDLYQRGQGNLAAYPGTSNHGFGLAVDLATPQMRQIVDRIGAKYGWAKAWSDAPTEWWHLKYRHGVYVPKPPTIEDRIRARPLRRGDKSHDVLVVQILLKRGRWLPHDAKLAAKVGTFGGVTERAVRHFQAHFRDDHKLKSDGVVGARTFAALKRRYGK